MKVEVKISEAPIPCTKRAKRDLKLLKKLLPEKYNEFVNNVRGRNILVAEKLREALSQYVVNILELIARILATRSIREIARLLFWLEFNDLEEVKKIREIEENMWKIAHKILDEHTFVGEDCCVVTFYCLEDKCNTNLITFFERVVRKALIEGVKVLKIGVEVYVVCSRYKKRGEFLIEEIRTCELSLRCTTNVNITV